MKFRELDLCPVCYRKLPEDGSPVPKHVGFL